MFELLINRTRENLNRHKAITFLLLPYQRWLKVITGHQSSSMTITISQKNFWSMCLIKMSHKNVSSKCIIKMSHHNFSSKCLIKCLIKFCYQNFSSKCLIKMSHQNLSSKCLLKWYTVCIRIQLRIYGQIHPFAVYPSSRLNTDTVFLW